MAILDILEFPDPRLRTKAQPVETVDAGVRQLVDDMFETMYEAPGVGLAATQVNVHQRVIVIDDGSGDGTAPWLARRAGAQWAQNPQEGQWVTRRMLRQMRRYLRLNRLRQQLPRTLA